MGSPVLFPPFLGPAPAEAPGVAPLAVAPALPAPLSLLAAVPGLGLLPDPVGFDPLVYVALGSGGEVLYVGRTRDLFPRIGRHRSAWGEIRARRPVAWVSFRVAAPDVALVEEGLIRLLRPQLNRTRTGHHAAPTRQQVARMRAHQIDPA